MASNTFTNLAADAYVAADIVARERTGFVGGVTLNGSGSQEAAKGQTVRAAFTRDASPVAASPGITPPAASGQTIDNKTLQLTEDYAVRFEWEGEESSFLDAGPGYRTTMGQQLQQAIRALVNQIDADIAVEAYQNASRAVGTAGTTPFGSNIDVLADALRVLEDNGVPDDMNLQAVFGPAAIANLRKLSLLQKVNESGNGDVLRRGAVGDLMDMMIRQSKFAQAHTKGTGTGYLINNASGEAVGQTTLTLDTGSGTILAGDVITHASDANNKYVVNTALSGGDLVIGDPGLVVAAADNDAITVGNSYAANVAFHRSAIELAMRAPRMPSGGDAARERTIIQDPVSGLTFSLAIYAEYRQTMVEVAAVWGVKAWLPKYIVNVMG